MDGGDIGNRCSGITDKTTDLSYLMVTSRVMCRVATLPDEEVSVVVPDLLEAGS
jgi:hypothetical protein